MKPISTEEITGLWTYLGTIDWTEPWFMGLAAFHVMCAVTTYLTCRHQTVQAVVFACFLVLVGCSEYINEFAARHWRKFSHQQYFDSSGLFISVVFSVPILGNCLVMVVLWLKTSADLMSGIRRRQLQRQARKEGEATAVSDGSEEQTTTDAATAQTSGASKKDN